MKKATQADIDKINAKQELIQKYIINPDGTVDAVEVDLSNEKITELPFQFGTTGNFYCNKNLLTSLKSSPHIVNGDFYCRGSRNSSLISLKGIPEIIEGDFICGLNGNLPLQEILINILHVNGIKKFHTDYRNLILYKFYEGSPYEKITLLFEETWNK